MREEGRERGRERVREGERGEEDTHTISCVPSIMPYYRIGET